MVWKPVKSPFCPFFALKFTKMEIFIQILNVKVPNPSSLLRDYIENVVNRGWGKKSRQQVLQYIFKTIAPKVNFYFKWSKWNVSRIKIRYNTSLYLNYHWRYGLHEIASIFCFSHIYIVILSFLTKTRKLENGCFNIFCCIFNNIRVTETCNTSF